MTRVTFVLLFVLKNECIRLLFVDLSKNSSNTIFDSYFFEYFFSSSWKMKNSKILEHIILKYSHYWCNKWLNTIIKMSQNTKRSFSFIFKRSLYFYSRININWTNVENNFRENINKKNLKLYFKSTKANEKGFRNIVHCQKQKE